MHQTQAKGYLDAISKMDEAQIEKMAASDGWTDPQRFVLGKSLVGGSVTGDIFENIAPGAIPFVRPSAAPEPERQEVSAELGGPWSYYAEFRRAHGLSQLPHPEPPEIALQAGTTLAVPLWLRNRTGATREVTLSADLPAGWTVQGGAGKFTLAAKQVAAVRVDIALPELGDADPKKQEPREVTVRAESNGQSIGIVKLRVVLRKRTLPQ
jgi:hypothetical protein